MPPPQKKTTLTPKTYYAVKIGHQPGIYPCWDKGAKEQVQGYQGAVFKKFKDIEEAKTFMDKRNITIESATEDRKFQQLECKRVTAAFKTGIILDLNNHLDIKTPQQSATHSQLAQDLVTAQPTATIHLRNWTKHQAKYYLFTDGSLIPKKHVGYGICLSIGSKSSNQQHKPLDINNSKKSTICMSRVMPLGTTNNQCEMLAIIGSLQLAWLFKDYFGTKDTHNSNKLYARHLVIVSDSEYCINSITKWTTQWKANKWITAAGKPVKNKELLEKINNLLQQLKPHLTISFLHQNSHLPAPPTTASTITRLLWEGNYLVDLAAKYHP